MYFSFYMWWKDPDIDTSVLSPPLCPPCLLHFSSYSTRPFPKGKRPSCVKSETGLIPVSSVHKRVQLCIQNLKKYGVCVSVRKREKEGEKWNEPSYAYKALLSWHLGQLDAFTGNSSSSHKVPVKATFDQIWSKNRAIMCDCEKRQRHFDHSTKYGMCLSQLSMF